MSISIVREIAVSQREVCVLDEYDTSSPSVINELILVHLDSMIEFLPSFVLGLEMEHWTANVRRNDIVVTALNEKIVGIMDIQTGCSILKGKIWSECVKVPISECYSIDDYWAHAKGDQQPGVSDIVESAIY